MSGGHWNYSGYRIQDELRIIAEDEQAGSRWPRLMAAFRYLGDALYNLEREMDYDLSSDSHIDDDRVFEEQALWQLGACVNKAQYEQTSD